MYAKAGILSDTHGLLRPEVVEQLRDCSLILHGGDIGGHEILDRLVRLAPVRAVRGNNDGKWIGKLPLTDTVDFHGVRILLCHRRKDIPAIQPRDGVQLVVYGHSHRYADTYEQGIRFCNPGSCGPRRFHLDISMAILEVPQEGSFQIRQVLLSQGDENRKIPDSETDREQMVRTVVKGIHKGLTTEGIAGSYHISLALTEEISRMYLTHPGIDVDGILNRLRG